MIAKPFILGISENYFSTSKQEFGKLSIIGIRMRIFSIRPIFHFNRDFSQ
jgi:hypothetical protein